MPSKIIRPTIYEEMIELRNLQSSQIIFMVMEARILDSFNFTKGLCLLEEEHCELRKNFDDTELANLKISNWGSQLLYPSIAPPSLCHRGKVGGPPGVVVGVLFEGIPLFVKG